MPKYTGTLKKQTSQFTFIVAPWRNQDFSFRGIEDKVIPKVSINIIKIN